LRSRGSPSGVCVHYLLERMEIPVPWTLIVPHAEWANFNAISIALNGRRFSQASTAKPTGNIRSRPSGTIFTDLVEPLTSLEIGCWSVNNSAAMEKTGVA